jgi:hypothetical protein
MLRIFMKKIALSLAFLAVLLMAISPIASATTAVTDKYSTNWCGYVATAPTPFTSVSASWTVPTLTEDSATAYSGIWVGIGGWYRNSNKLIQVGTEQDVLSGDSSYSVWYEVYPKAPVNIGSISFRDSVTAQISENTGNPPTWHITITDTTNSTTLLDTDVKAKTNFAAEATAEFIVERPLLVVGHQTAPLADFTSVTFNDCTVTANDVSSGLGSLTSAYNVIMTSDGTSSGTILAYPDALSGDSFSVNWGAPP